MYFAILYLEMDFTLMKSVEYYSNIFEKHHISFYRLKIIKFIELYCTELH